MAKTEGKKTDKFRKLLCRVFLQFELQISYSKFAELINTQNVWEVFITRHPESNHLASGGTQKKDLPAGFLTRPVDTCLTVGT